MPVVIKLDQLLKKRKVLLKDLAKQLGMTNVNLSRIKTGKVRAIKFSTLDKICIALDCAPGDLLVQVSNDEAQDFYGDDYLDYLASFEDDD